MWKAPCINLRDLLAVSSLRGLSRGFAGSCLSCFAQSSNSPIAAIGSPWNAPQANHASPSAAWISMIFLTAFSKMTQRSFFSSNASILNIGGNYFSILFNCNILSNCDTSKLYPCLGGLPWQKAFLLFAIPKQGKLAPRQYKRDSLSCRCVSLRRRRAFLLVKEDG